MVTGLLLAAGAGRRYGGPKALAHDPDGTSWLLRSVDVLLEGGCSRVLVVLGAGAAAARALLGERSDVEALVAEEWASGMGVSLRCGLEALTAAPPACVAALVHLVDLPDVGTDVVARVLAGLTGPGDLARAAYQGRPGHPVLLGRDHWAAIATAATGDRGASDYLARHDHALVPCGDLADGRDRDTRDTGDIGGPTPSQRDPL